MKDPIKACLHSLTGCGDPRIRYFAWRDLMGREVGPVSTLWKLPSATAILRKQLPSGSWRYPNSGAKTARPLQNYDQLETYRRLGQLVELHGFDRTHPALKRAALFLFGKQTSEGDFRGIYGRQYTPNYTASIVELLVKAGYGEDRRIEKAFRWLLSVRQDDGGWAIPVRTSRTQFGTRALHSAIRFPKALEPDFGRPSSWMVTGMVLRAFAAHDKLRGSSEARRAAELLSSRFFRRDAYIDRCAPEYWERVTFPFWFTDIVSALDSLSLLEPTMFYDEEVQNALQRLAAHQSPSGLFEFKLLKTGDPMLRYWESLAVCRIFSRSVKTLRAG